MRVRGAASNAAPFSATGACRVLATQVGAISLPVFDLKGFETRVSKSPV